MFSCISSIRIYNDDDNNDDNDNLYHSSNNNCIIHIVIKGMVTNYSYNITITAIDVDRFYYMEYLYSIYFFYLVYARRTHPLYILRLLSTDLCHRLSPLPSFRHLSTTS